MNNNKYPKPASGGFFSILSGLILAFVLLFLILGADQLFSIDRIQILSRMKPVTQISWELPKDKSKSIKEFSFMEAIPEVMENEPEKMVLFQTRKRIKSEAKS